jgi:hypothetical protein
MIKHICGSLQRGLPALSRFITAAMVAWAVTFVLCGSAIAQTVDVRPAVNTLLDTAASVVAAATTITLGLLSRFLWSRIGMSNSELERHLSDRLNDIIHKGIEFALTAAKNEVNKPGSGLEAVKFDNYFMSLAASYIVRSAPDIIKRFTITQARLEEMIMARLPAYLSEVPITGGASAPATVLTVNRETGMPQAKTSDPVLSRPVVVDAAEPDRKPQVPGFNEAPDTGN